MKLISKLLSFDYKQITQEQFFMLTILIVNAGNYAYNLLLGRILGPEQFADAAILITLLLVLSFIGMTFQIVTAKYAVLFENDKLSLFIKFISKYALLFGLLFGVMISFFSAHLQIVFHTETATMFLLFGLGIPLYFLMSVNRGLFQGKNQFNELSKTYTTEMLSRLCLTILAVLFVTDVSPSIIVALGIIISFVFGLYPFQKSITQKLSPTTTSIDKKAVITFFAITAFYELTQIIINNSDIILVKHFFNNTNAGLYASLALIGRVVYFVAWMFVMLLLPKVIQMKKEGKDTLPILIKYVTYIGILSSSIVCFTALFPEFVIKIMFGDAYISIAFLLWKYALATSLFAIANIFAYYFLSINQYFPVVVSAVLGCTQIFLIIAFHDSLEEVVHMQIIAMVILLFFQVFYFFLQNRKAAVN